MSNKMWEALLEHAKTCVVSGKLYVYYPDETRNVGVAFNNIYELTGLITGEQYQHIDSLSDSEKVNCFLYANLKQLDFAILVALTYMFLPMFPRPVIISFSNSALCICSIFVFVLGQAHCHQVAIYYSLIPSPFFTVFSLLDALLSCM